MPVEEGNQFCSNCGARLEDSDWGKQKPLGTKAEDSNGEEPKTPRPEKSGGEGEAFRNNFRNKIPYILVVAAIGFIVIGLGNLFFPKNTGTRIEASGGDKAGGGSTTETPAVTTSFDAFAEISLVFSGDTTQGTVEVIDNSDGSKNLSYDIILPDNLSNGMLSNGDTVTVSVHPAGEETFTDEYAQEYGGWPQTTTKTYTVEGLSNFYYREWDAPALQVTIWDTTLVDGYQKIADAFTERTGIPVDVRGENFNTFWEEVDDRSLVDVFWMSGYESEKSMYEEDLLDLTGYIAEDGIDLRHFNEEYTDMFMRDDKVYAIPMGIDTIALWYNRAIFDEVGIDYPDETWSWDTVYEAAQQINDSGNNRYGYAINFGNDQDGYYNLIYAHDGYVVSDDWSESGYDDDNTLEAFDYIWRLRQYSVPRSVLEENSNNINALIKSGQVAMCLRGSWTAPEFFQNEYIRENFDAAIIPYDAETGKRVSIVNCVGWAASKRTDYPEESALLIEWFCSEEMQKMQGELGVYIPAYEGLEDSFADYTDVFNLSAYLDVLEADTGYITNELVMMPHSYDTEAWRPSVKGYFRKAWDGEISIEEACTESAKAMNRCLSVEPTKHYQNEIPQLNPGTGSSNDSENEGGPSNNSTSDADSAKIEEEELYADVLDMYYENIQSGWEYYWEDASNGGAPIYSTFLFALYYADPSYIESIGYSFIDLNDDGVDELLIGADEIIEEDFDNDLFRNIICDLYTYMDGQVVHLASSGERYTVRLCEGNKILEWSTGGAYDTSFTLSQLSEDRPVLSIIDGVTSDSDGYDGMNWYRRTSGTYIFAEGISDETLSPITDEEVDEIMDSWPETIDFSLTYFSEYTPQNN